MRQLWTLCLATCVGLALIVGRSNASEGFDDIAKLAKSGVTEDILVTFVQASPVPYELSVDEILFLNDLGVTPKAIQEIINHGRDLRAGNEPVITTQAPVDNNPMPYEDPVAVPVSLANYDGDRAQQLPPDPNNPNAQPVEQTGYISPLTGEISETPELVHESRIVRETVYTPTPVAACTDCTISHFYEALTPYGTWVDMNGTWCWQPAVGSADSSWQPYGHRGHWVWTDAGWCWESDYSWGWAPFHYGRWWRAPGYGWMWTPDTVWGPAWVNWRQNDSHWGWAPLPPAARFETAGAGAGFHFGGRHFGVNVGIEFGLSERDYCFVPQDHFCDRNLTVAFEPRERRTLLYSQTTIIQNNIVIQNNTVFVNGPSYHVVETRINRPLVQIRISDADVRVGVTLSRGSFEDRDNHTLRFYRPHISSVAVESPVEIAARQVAVTAGRERPTADVRVLAASARADELRERHFATQDARRQESLTRQSEVIEEVSARRSDNEQKRLNTLAAKADNAQDRAAFAAKANAERQRAEEARLQKASLEKQAAEQRKQTAQLAEEQNRVARATVNAESAKQAQAAKQELVAQRLARENANKESAAATERALAEQRAKNAAIRGATKTDVESKARATAADRQARLEAERTAREASRKTQEDLLARQRAQLEADRAARAKTAAEHPASLPPARLNNDTTPAIKTPRESNRASNSIVTPPTNPAGEKAAERVAERADEKAAREAAAEANRQKAEATRAANAERAATIKAEREKPAAQRPPVTPATGQPNDPNETKTPREINRTPNAVVTPPAHPAAEKAAERVAERAEEKAAREAAAEANRQKAEATRAANAERAANMKAEREKPAAQRAPVTPATGQPNDPNETKTPREINRTPNSIVTPPTNPASEKAAERVAERAEEKAAREAAAEANRQRAEATRAANAERAANIKAEREKPAAQRLPVNPKTGQTYDPNDPNDPNNPRKTK